MRLKPYIIIIIGGIVLLSLTISVQAAVTVYFKDGTRLEVDKVVRMGDSVALFVDLSRIDTRRTPIEESRMEDVLRDSGLKTESSPQQGLAVTNLRFEPSADNMDIIATGTIENHTQQRLSNLHITVTLMDQREQVLLTIHGYPYPDVLNPGQSGAYAFRARKPEHFSKATVEVNTEAR